ncbi:Alanine racemase [Lachnospiraceae bacterium TWA4]|nr:Alanine racemase [Lachnospiraceae bacterium TWA4]
MSNGYRVKAEVDLEAIYQNIVKLKAMVPEGKKMCAVIKTDGYGHGAVQIAKKVDKIVDFYAIATIEEALELRQAGITTPLLILGFSEIGDFETLILNDVRPTIFEVEDAIEFSKVAKRLGKTAKIHVKLDTGMGRLGFYAGDDYTVAKILEISKLENIEIEGMFTHFAKADEKDKTAVNEQLRLFTKVANELKEAGLQIPILHCSNSAGIIDDHGKEFDMVRAGIVIYGLYPSDEVHKERVKLEPALTLKSHIVYLKEVEAGRQISYGGTFTAPKTMKVATIPVGYGDGYPRLLSNKGEVLIRGQRAKILGRVCMDQFMADVTDIEGVAKGDEVILIGKSGNEEILADEIANLTGTINYEVVCDLGKRIPRYYKNI